MKERYFAIMNRAFSAYTPEAVRDYYERVKHDGMTEHGFPRLTANLAILIAHGMHEELCGLMGDMMTLCCREMHLHKKAGNDFAVKELVFALLALEEKKAVPKEVTDGWRAALAMIEPLACYDKPAPAADIPVGNWAAFNAASEQMRVFSGICDKEKGADFIDREVGSQLPSFDENGMYRDPNNPMLYDVATRAQLAVLLHFGYDGKYREELEKQYLWSVPLTLRMQSVTGALPYGGRSNQFLHNEATFAAVFEFCAGLLWKKGERELAGQCKRAASLAAGNIERWLDDAPGKHVKNNFPVESQHGCESYAYFDKYMITLASFTYMAYLFADDSIPACPAPAETGQYIAVTSPSFHKVFLNSCGYFLEFDTNADPHYDGSGLGRIHKKGAPEALCLSVPFPSGHSNYELEKPNPHPLALCGTMDNAGEGAIGAETFYSVESAVSGDGYEEISFRSMAGIFETYRVSENGVEISVVTRLKTGYQLPVFLTDGREQTVIRQEEHALVVSYRGFKCRYETDGDIADTNRDFGNRNGVYRLYHVNKPNGNKLFIHIQITESAR